MKEEICREYLDALNEGNLEKVLSLFVPDAVVHSPLYGEVAATQFYTDLFSDTSESETQLLNVFDSMGTGSSIALHFLYAWTLKSGEKVHFECVDVFETDPSARKFKKLKIIYDTAPLRGSFNESKKGKTQG